MKTITYSRVGELDIQLDVYPPSSWKGPRPTLVFFHGGGLVAGGRKTLFLQKWLLGDHFTHTLARAVPTDSPRKDSALEEGFLFISADYRLLHPSTGFDIIEDVKSLFTFLATPNAMKQHLPDDLELDLSRIAVSGESGGGYPAMAAGIYAKPKPKVVMLQYAMGGQLLSDHYIAPKDEALMPAEGQGADRASVAHLLNESQGPISYDPLIQLGDEPLYQGQTQSDRGKLLPYWLRTGQFVDYLLDDRVSQILSGVPLDKRMDVIPQTMKLAILQGQLDATFPPTFLLHGKADTLVPPDESQSTYNTLKSLGVKVQLELLEGAGHGLMSEISSAPTGPPKLVDGARNTQRRAFEFLGAELGA